MLLGGSPMLSTSVAISWLGITRRIAASMRAKRTAVSSTLVPTGTRACIRIWPPSTEGKKLLPRKGSSAKDASTKVMKAVTNGQRWAIASRSRSR